MVNSKVLRSIAIALMMLLFVAGQAQAYELTPTPSGPWVENSFLTCPGSKGTRPIPFPVGGKSVTGGWWGEPDNIVPYYTQMSNSIWITQLTLEGLAEWNNKGNLVPALAVVIPTVENHGISADGLTITWHLRPCLYWSDGQPLTSVDVKFTWEYILDSPNRTGYDKIASIDTPNATTVVLHFSELYPPWQNLFTQGPNNQGAILPWHILGWKFLESDTFNHWPTVSSGPWVITDWVAGEQMTLLPNPNFYKGRPILDRIVIKFPFDGEAALAALLTGEIDWYPDFAESDIPEVGAHEPVVHLKVVPGADFEHYFFNLGTTAGVGGQGKSDVDGFCPFKDARVRKAIILGINRKGIVNTLLWGKTVVPASLWPNSSWTNSTLTPEPYDPNTAKQLLDQAGYTPGLDGIRHGLCNGVDTKLSFTFKTTTQQLRVDMALAVKSNLKKIGIEFNPIHLTAGIFFGDYASGGDLPHGNFDMAGYTTGFYPDPYTDAFLCSNVPSADNPGGTNNYHYCDPQFDALFASVNATVDPIARKTTLDAIQKYIYDNSLVVPMYVRMNVYGYTDRFVPGLFGFFSNMNWNSEIWNVKGN
jgi:peptide/nickel transport system substrate-binding protein